MLQSQRSENPQGQGSAGGGSEAGQGAAGLGIPGLRVLRWSAVSFALVTPYRSAVRADGGRSRCWRFRVQHTARAACRAVLGLDPESGGSPVLTAAAIVALVVLLALGARAARDPQPRHADGASGRGGVLRVRHLPVDARRRPAERRADAPRPRASFRAAHAEAVSATCRPVSASLTDRVLPNLFPTADEEVFTATVEQSVGVDRPRPCGWRR